MSELSRYSECRHILTSGNKCHSPALRGKLLCYYHSRSRTLVDANRSRKHSIALPPLEDRAAIQISLDEILAALGAHKITRREASTYLFALQIGSQNLSHMENSSAPPLLQLCKDEHGDVIAAEEPPLPAPTHSTLSEPISASSLSSNTDMESTNLDQSDLSEPQPATAADPEPNSSAEMESAGDPLLEDALPNLLLDDRNIHGTHEYDPEPPLPFTKKELKLKHRDIEENLRNYRESRAYYAAMPKDTPNEKPDVVVAYLNEQIEKMEAELRELNQQDTPDPPVRP